MTIKTPAWLMVIIIIICNTAIVQNVYAQQKNLVDKNLLHALENCNTKEVINFFQNRAMLNAKDSNGVNPLMQAVMYCDVDLVKQLVHLGAKPPDSAFIYTDSTRRGYYGNLTGIAAGKGKTELLSFLLDSLHISPDEREYNPATKKFDGWTPLFWAIYNHQPPIVKFLLSKNVYTQLADVAGTDNAITLAIENSDMEIFKLLLPHEKKISEETKKYLWVKADSIINFSSSNKAVAIKQLNIEFNKAYYGNASQQYGNSLNRMGVYYADNDEADKAIPYYEQAVAILLKAVGENDPDYIRTINNLAPQYSRIGKYNKALNLYGKVLRYSESQPDYENYNYSLMLNNLAAAYWDAGLYDSAQLYMMRTHNLTKKIKGENSFEYATTTSNLGVFFKDLGRYDEALKYMQLGLDLKRKVLGAQNVKYATSLTNLGGLYADMGQFQKALPMFEEALAISKKVSGEDSEEYGSFLALTASIYKDLGRFSDALEFYKRSLILRKFFLGEDHPDYASSLMGVAGVYKDMGNYELSLQYYMQAKDAVKRSLGEFHPTYSTILNNMAGIYSDMSQHTMALGLYNESLVLSEKASGKNSRDYLVTLGNIGTYYIETGEFEKALPVLQEVIQGIKRVLGVSDPSYVKELNILAGLYLRIGQYGRALPLLQQAVVQAKVIFGDKHPDYSDYLNSLAMLYNDMSEPEKALPLFKEALSIRETSLGRYHYLYGQCLNNIALTYSYLNKYDSVIQLFKEALTVYEKSGLNKTGVYTFTMMNIGGVYEQKKMFDSALLYYTAAMRIQNDALGQKNKNYILSQHILATLYWKMSRKDDATNLYSLSGKESIEELAKSYSSLSENEKMTYIDDNIRQFNFLPSILYSGNKREAAHINQLYNNNLALKGMVLQDQQNILRHIRKSNDTGLIRTYEQWKFYKAFLGQQQLLSNDKRAKNIDSIVQVTQELEQKLSRFSASFNKQGSDLGVKEIADHLAKSEAAIEFISFRLYTPKWTDSIMYAALLILPHDTVTRFIPLFEEEKLASLLKPSSAVVNNETVIKNLYRGGEADDDNQTGVRANDSLYRLIWKPLEPFLKNIKTVYYSPAGLLQRVAFQALRVDSTAFLIDKYQLNQVMSTRTVVSPYQIKTPSNAGVWGFINFDSTNAKSISTVSTSTIKNNTALIFGNESRSIRGGIWNQLPGTMDELDTVSFILNKNRSSVKKETGTVATEEEFKAMDGKSPALLHIATHGFFLHVADQKENENSNTHANKFTRQQNPMFRSGLVLAGANITWNGGTTNGEDGILTAYEISQMDLSNTDVVVLSACETALGDLKGNEGVIGLQRAFKMAGVKQLIMSLWRVPDKETMELMTAFYNNWLGGLSTREALRKAQLKLKEKYPPYYWAAFVLIE